MYLDASNLSFQNINKYAQGLQVEIKENNLDVVIQSVETLLPQINQHVEFFDFFVITVIQLSKENQKLAKKIDELIQPFLGEGYALSLQLLWLSRIPANPNNIASTVNLFTKLIKETKNPEIYKKAFANWMNYNQLSSYLIGLDSNYFDEL